MSEAALSAFPSPPREVFRRKGFPIALKAIGFFLLPHVWVGVFLLGMVLLTPAFMVFGRSETATVVSHELVHSKGTRTKIVYTYREGNRAFTDSATVRDTEYDYYRQGRTLAIRSLHIGSFGTSRLQSESLISGTLCCLGPFSLVWCTILFGFFHGWVLTPIAQRRLVKDGEAARGVVTDKTIRKGKSPTYVVSFTFDPRAGLQQSAEAVVDQSDYDATNAGDSLIILYDPRNPRRNHVYKFGQYGAKDHYGYEALG